MTLGSRLKYAREKVGLTLAVACERTGIGVSSLSEYENDKREPKMSQLAALARVYARTVSFFFGEQPLVAEVVLWRDKPDAQAVAAHESEFLQLCEQYHNLEAWAGARRSVQLPTVEPRSAEFTYDDAAALAVQTRSSLNLGDRPGPALRSVLEEVCGVKVLYRALPSGCAASTYSESFGPAIMLNTNNVPWRRTFDLAHELFHILTWRVFRGEGGGSTPVASDREESLANCFASHLLMPAEATRVAVDRVMHDGSAALDELDDVARQFDVSLEALLWRMTWLYKRSQEQTREDIERARYIIPTRDSNDYERPSQYPERYRSLAIRLLRRGDISLGKFSQFLGISRREAQAYLPQDADDDASVAITPA